MPQPERYRLFRMRRRQRATFFPSRSIPRLLTSSWRRFPERSETFSTGEQPMTPRATTEREHMFRDHSIFMTGGGGFIGSYLRERLADSNRITVFDTGHRNAIKFSTGANHPNIRMVQGDVLNRSEVAAAIKGADTIIHMAAVAGIDTVVTRPIR